MLKRIVASEAVSKSSSVFFKSLSQLYALVGMKVLSPFSGEGKDTISSYLPLVDTEKLECWTLNDEQTKAIAGMGIENVQQGCAYMLVKHAMLDGKKYDLIDLDTPQGVHKDWHGAQMVEHFTFFRECLSLIDEKGLLVVCVNKNPYDAAKLEGKKLPFSYMHWLAGRRSFYGTETVTEEQAIAAYRHVLEEYGFELVHVVLHPIASDVIVLPPYKFRMALEIRLK